MKCGKKDVTCWCILGFGRVERSEEGCTMSKLIGERISKRSE